MNTANPFERIPSNPYEKTGTIIDDILEASLGDHESVPNIALQHWNSLHPDVRRLLQVKSTDMANDNMALSGQCARDLLVLDLVGAQAA